MPPCIGVVGALCMHPALCWGRVRLLGARAGGVLCEAVGEEQVPADLCVQMALCWGRLWLLGGRARAGAHSVKRLVKSRWRS